MATAERAHATLDQAQMARAKKSVLQLRANGWSAAYCAAQAGISRRCLYHWLEADPDFAQAWSDANECHHDWYEDRLRDRAANGGDVAIVVGLKMSGRFIDKGGAADPEQTGRAILEAMRQIVADQRRQLPEPATPVPALTADTALPATAGDKL